MFRSRKSRESRSIDPSAFAAASTIGKALVPSKDTIGGQVVDKNKIPRYSMSGRTLSMVNLQQPPSRSNSATLRTNKHRYGSLRGSSEDLEDVHGTFNEFGGKEEKYVPGPTGLVKLDEIQKKPRMVSKYVPSSHGLIKVEVSVEDYERQRHNSIKRSVSMHSGLNVRRGVPTKKSNASLRSSSQMTVRSRVLVEEPLYEEKNEAKRSENSASGRNEGSTSKVDGKTSPRHYENIEKLIDTSIKSEDSHDLKGKESTEKGQVKNIEPASKVMVPDLVITDENAEFQFSHHDDAVRTANDVFPTVTKTEETYVDAKSLEEPKVTPASTIPNELINVEKTVPKPSTESEEFSSLEEEGSDSVIMKEHDQQSAEALKQKSKEFLNEKEKIIAEKHTTSSANGVHGAEEQHPKNNGVKSGDKLNVSSKGEPQNKSKSSLAQYIRSANPELQRIHEDKLTARKTSSNKTTSPIKSAMKKSTRSENIRDQASSSSAYLSLTTRENTKLNAQLSSENLRADSKRQPVPPRRNQQRPQSMMAQRLNGDRQSFINSHATPTRNPQRPNSTVLKNPTKPTLRADLYPEEPPQKRSSFEKQRPASTNLGFKKLSLRQEFEEASSNVAGDEQIQQTPRRNSSVSVGTLNGVRHASGTMNYSPKVVTNQPIQGSRAFKSRFADSDSDEDSMNVPFSSGASRSTQLTAHSDPAPPVQPPYNPTEKFRTTKNHVQPEVEKEHKKKGIKFSKIKKLFGSKKY